MVIYDYAYACIMVTLVLMLMLVLVSIVRTGLNISRIIVYQLHLSKF